MLGVVLGSTLSHLPAWLPRCVKAEQLLVSKGSFSSPGGCCSFETKHLSWPRTQTTQHSYILLSQQHYIESQRAEAWLVCLQSYCLEGADDSEEEQLFETWLLLEYCDKGSLQDAVDRGWFHTDKHGHVDSKTKPNMHAIRYHPPTFTHLCTQLCTMLVRVMEMFPLYFVR